ncbi:MAG: amidohydrolase family protein [Provencibacterium sp.]|nr:amidohydrolase family protein [Provencibacterium sp.]
MKTLITGGLVYDGTGAPPLQADVLFEDGKILEIGRIPPEAADTLLAAEKKAVTPGFIDSHRHADLAALADPDFGEAELAQGITTCLTGNCGLAPFPSRPQTFPEVLDFIEPCLGSAPPGLQPGSFADYLKQLQGKSWPLNIGGLAATGAVKAAVKGYGKSPFTRQEMADAQQMLKEALLSGAFGLSAGIMYTPECYSSKEEFIRLLAPAAPFARPLCCHIRGEGDSLVASVQEAISLADEAGLPLNISHFKSVGCRNWREQIFRAIEKIEAARSRGQDVTVDFYPYTGGSTTLLTLIPPSLTGSTTGETLRALDAPDGAERLKKDLLRDWPGWDNMVDSIGWERVIISSVARQENKPLQGRDVAEICQKSGEDEAAFICRLLVEEQGKVGVVLMSMDQADVDTVARLPYSMVISDSLYGAPDCPHPRLFGSFGRIFRDMVRERGILCFEEALHKMTGMTAERFGLKGRGFLRPGYVADINIFSPEAFGDRGDYSHPRQLCQGMEMVFVGGRMVWNSRGRTGKNSGTVLLAAQ